MRYLARLACLFIGLHGAAFASDWPTQPIKIVVNFAPGGAADQLARIVAPALSKDLGVPVVIDNRAGAGGNIGAEHVVKANPDGNTILMSSGGLFSTNKLIYKTMSFSPFDDLSPIGAVARVPFFLVVPAASPVQKLGDLAAVSRTTGRALNYGSPGNGSAPHIASEQLASALGIRPTHIPYKGAAPALTDLLAGQIDFLFDPGIALQHVKSGKLRALGVGSPQRHPNYPEIPTLIEQGVKDFDADSIFALYGPKALPRPVVDRIAASLRKTLGDPAYRTQILAMGSMPAIFGPDELDKKNRADFEKIKVVAEKAKIQVD